jgi:hypothetical protein
MKRLEIGASLRGLAVVMAIVLIVALVRAAFAFPAGQRRASDAPTQAPVGLVGAQKEALEPTEAPEAPEIGEPTDAPEIGEPTEAPEIGEPAKAPEIGEPAKAPEIGEPTDASEIGEPTEAPESDNLPSAGIAPSLPISAAQAQSIVLAANPGAAVVELKLDDEDGASIYKIKLSTGAKIKVDAQHGTIIDVKPAEGDD